jgi:hypothetical protein
VEHQHVVARRPAVGRFLSIDPIAGGSCNRYEYACADPRNKYDLDGTALMERVQTDCKSYNCVRIRRICDRSSKKCSLQWDMWFRRGWSSAYIYAGWRYQLSVRGFKVFSGSYSHGELGWYNFTGTGTATEPGANTVATASPAGWTRATRCSSPRPASPGSATPSTTGSDSRTSAAEAATGTEPRRHTMSPAEPD